MLKIATAFSGGLAAPEFALRYENIKHEVVFACEWDKYARQQYLHFHGKPQTFYKDIKDLDATQYKNEIDLFVWGSPCQDLSLAGKRKGFDGAKSSLFREGARVMREMMPKCFIFENVKGLLSSNNGNDYKEVVSTFQKLGYHCTMQVMNTKDYGVPQNRERVFIVGFLDYNEHLGFEFEKPIKLTKKLRDILEDDVDEKYYLSDKQYKSLINPKYESMGMDRVNNIDDICNCLTTMEGGNREPKILQKERGFNKGGEHSICPTITINSFQENNYLLKNYRIRKLTPTECYRLQGVKDEDIDLVVSNTQAYKIAGNAISVNVMQSILRSIYKIKSVNLFYFINTTQKVEVC